MLAGQSRKDKIKKTYLWQAPISALASSIFQCGSYRAEMSLMGALCYFQVLLSTHLYKWSEVQTSPKTLVHIPCGVFKIFMMLF